MGDVKYWDTSYGKALDELDVQVKAVKTAAAADREARIGTATQTVRRLQGMKRSYNLEIKLMRDPAQKASFQEEKNSKDARLDALEAQLEELKNKPAGGDKSSLFSKATPTAPTVMTADQKLDQASAIQDKTEAKYKNMITVLQTTEEVATNTAATLVDQRAQINEITENVMEIDGMLTRANKLIMIFSRRLATDKFIQCFGFINVCALVAIIVYVVIKQVGLPGSEKTATPPSIVSTPVPTVPAAAL